MGQPEIQAVLEDLIAKPSAQAAFRTDPASYLSRFGLNDSEKAAFAQLELDCLIKTAGFLNRFSDAELSIGAVWIKPN